MESWLEENNDTEVLQGGGGGGVGADMREERIGLPSMAFPVHPLEKCGTLNFLCYFDLSCTHSHYNSAPLC